MDPHLMQLALHEDPAKAKAAAPELRAAAARLGVTIGELREMAEDFRLHVPWPASRVPA